MKMTFQNFLKSDKIYSPSNIDYILDLLDGETPIIKTNKKIEYLNIPCGFDIETTSFFHTCGNEEEKTAIMYVWTFGINGIIVMGRTWEEFVTMLNTISKKLKLSKEKRIVIYVHNLSYEFQFMRKWFTWIDSFNLELRKPIWAVTDTGIEFRCSYLLSGYSLAKLAEQLNGYNIKKLVGDLDYNLIRHCGTPLTENEIAYCVNDVKIVMTYIDNRIKQDGNITLIPMTKTGYVRKYCRNNCFYTDGNPHNKDYKKLRYMDFMKRLRLTPEEYKQLKRAFQGGFTHANPFYVGKVVKNVGSDDFTSSYPAVMLSEKFPMSSSEVIPNMTREEFEKNIKLYCCLFDVEFKGIYSKVIFENYISISRCWKTINPVINNGRVVSAEVLHTTLTEQDYFIITQMYEWDSIAIKNFRRYKRGYLPTDFIKSILKLYGDKTTLKGVSGKEVEYLQSKEMINSCYGMAVTDIVRDMITYDNEWGKVKPDIEKTIAKYNNNKSRFLFYPWGVWVTAYARRNLFTGILEFKNDYIYSDTDSIKTINRQSHIEYINKYNQSITAKLKKAMEYHNLPEELTHPKTIQGKEKPLGVWDYEGTYTRFKTLGAKRYMTDNNGKINITVSGLNKSVCVPYLIKKYENNVFNAFTEDLYIPPQYTGKNIHTYIDDKRKGVLKDYTGVQGAYYEKSSVHLMQADYNLSLAEEFTDYVKYIQWEMLIK